MVCVLSDRRSKSLREEIKALKKKEVKETKALEDMIQKVEENLIAATVSLLIRTFVAFVAFVAFASICRIRKQNKTAIDYNML